jgi:hypothetical protein
MTTKIELNEEQAALLERLIDYTYNAEWKSYEEHIDNGGSPESHIYHTALQLNKTLADTDVAKHFENGEDRFTNWRGDSDGSVGVD